MKYQMRNLDLATLAAVGVAFFLSVAAAQQSSVSASSGSVNVSCEEWASTEVRLPIPNGSRVLNVSAQWVDLQNTTDTRQSVETVNGVLIATGAIRGQAKRSLMFGMECPGGGHGTLQITGSFTRD